MAMPIVNFSSPLQAADATGKNVVHAAPTCDYEADSSDTSVVLPINQIGVLDECSLQVPSLRFFCSPTSKLQGPYWF